MNITDAAIDAASLALHCDACTDDEHDACDRSDWEREARVALEAALPHLQPTIPTGPADPGERARRVEQAAMLEAAQVPDELVAVTCKIAARGKILTDDLVAIERAGITLGVEVAMPERDGRYQGDDGEWAVRHRKTRVIRAMRDRGDAENEARLNPDVEVVRRTVTAWRAP